MKLYILFAILLLCFNPLMAQESIVCVHGFMRTPKSMAKMARAFEKEGYRATNWGYPSKEGRVGEHALYLNAKLQEIARNYPGEPIHFVTHSLGGIIVRAALNLESCPEEAKYGAAVLLAPPNQGSKFAHYLSKYRWVQGIFGEYAGAELLEKKNFDAIGEFPEGMRLMVIGGVAGLNPWAPGKNDGKVSFEETCLNTPHDHRKTWAGHSFMMWDKKVIRCSIDFIAARP